MIKKSRIVFILFLSLMLITGCLSNEEKDYKVMHCTRDAKSTAGDNVNIKLSYQIYYKDDYVKKVIATDEVTSSDSSVIEQYASSYKKIYASYDGLEHFSNKIDVSTHSMTSVTEIDYAHIDTDRLLEIEGKDDNVIDKDGKVPLKDFIAFYEKYGADCEK